MACILWLLVCIEVAARALLFPDRVFRVIRGTDDSSFRIDWVKRHLRENRLPVAPGTDQRFTYDFLVYDPVRGWALKPNLRDATVFRNKTLSSNSKGIRGKGEYDYRRQPGKGRIIVLGDSYSFGDEVSDDETYSHYLEDFLPGTEVLNMGLSGYGHDQMLLYLQKEGVKYQPDVVLVGFVWFDVFRNLWNFNSYAKPRFELADGKLLLTNVPVPNPESVLHDEVYRSKALDLGVMLLGKLEWASGVAPKHAQELTRAIFDEIVTTSREAGAQPAFVYLPVTQEMLDTDSDMTPDERYLLSYCEDRRVPCLFLRPRFAEESKKGVVFNSRVHWEPSTHRLAAEQIRDFLRERNLNPTSVFSLK